MLLPLDFPMVMFLLQEIMIATVFPNLGICILVAKERESGEEGDGSVSRSPRYDTGPKPKY